MRPVRLLAIALLVALVSIISSFRLAAAQGGMTDPTSGSQTTRTRFRGVDAQPRIFVPVNLVDLRAIIGFTFETNLSLGWLPIRAPGFSASATLPARRRGAL